MGGVSCPLALMHMAAEKCVRSADFWCCMLSAHVGTDDNVFIVVKSQGVEVVYSRVKHTCVNTPIK